MIFLQQLHPDIHRSIRLSEHPLSMTKRLADLAITLVTSNDELIGSIEGLDCITIDFLYHSNAGNLPRSWVALRKAITTGQLMGLDRSDLRVHYKVLDPNYTNNSETMWLQTIMRDRYLLSCWASLKALQTVAWLLPIDSCTILRSAASSECILLSPRRF